ncbi:alpha/beta fold hydrolase [Cryptosporangium aurantiacum]|uniref:Pimeloyl-ACP methyl ester carboxylesterase n=1 Tax=Cryptosporangium aurantiacum TaxID=134849 RepID=A0A1M7QNP3_9ACTN|nr:alpha/beta hydrolase [Cryptosporangium aurantiacum]SHN32984.1 Pimeloyl-ACP methyl ester carboxylesterase [Cryptosporangium aurantiacum]
MPQDELTLEQWSSGSLTFDVRVSGPHDGEPVVLLHGFPQNSGEWDAVSRRLNEAGYRTYAPDQRGYSPGARPQGVDAYRMDHLVADVVSLLDSRDLESAHIVGHDWGAAVAWHLTGRHPDRVRTLTALSVPHPHALINALRDDPDQRKKSTYMLFFRRRWVSERALLTFDGRLLRRSFDGSGLSRADVDRYVRPLKERGALTGALNWYRAMSGRESAEAAPVRVPTTYVWSDGDLALGRAAAEACGTFVESDYTYVELTGLSHWLPDQAPERIAEIILARVRG